MVLFGLIFSYFIKSFVALQTQCSNFEYLRCLCWLFNAIV